MARMTERAMVEELCFMSVDALAMIGGKTGECW